jgi:hypothetical protein
MHCPLFPNSEFRELRLRTCRSAWRASPAAIGASAGAVESASHNLSITAALACSGFAMGAVASKRTAGGVEDIWTLDF